ncbi:hypothetical protein CGCS363_v008058 [Colletotrichum siamense]|uniref:uncharacterized protein n=1 Tax=Colletotrichum siamense TaxID=690259 RepID=UPI00187237CD|nr:uncharacterized protein CGCS363_v008058 [Colletotrichum siamense]KAF5497276.1 hypothetical protein CGCS363_v008058 [Colletotrichum siamense]
MTHTRRRGRELNLVGLPKQILFGCLHYPTEPSVMPLADMPGDIDNEPTPRMARGRGKARTGSPVTSIRAYPSWTTVWVPPKERG